LRHAGGWSHPGSEATISLQPGRRRAEVRSVDAARQGRGAAGTRRGRDAAEIHQTGVSPWLPGRPTTDSWAPVQSRARSRLPSQAEPEHGQAIPRRPGLPAGTRRRSRGVRNPCRQPARRGRRLLVDPVHRRSRGNRGRRHRRLRRRRKKGPDPAIRPASSTPAPSTESSCPTWRPWRIRPAGRASTSSAGTLRKACRAGRHG